MKKYIALLIALVFALAGFVSAPAYAAAGDSVDNPILVEPVNVPTSAVEDKDSTYVTPNKCDTTRSWTLTVPGQEETYHNEYRYRRDVPAVDEVSHNEYKYKKLVVDYKTQYHFSKFTRTKTKSADVDGFWQNFEPNRDQGVFVGPPTWPSDPRGTWSAKKFNGGPQQDASGVYQNGQGNGSWFYRQQFIEGVWGPFGEWTEWQPETHTSWEDSTDPLGQPQFHGEDTNLDGTKWYREWQAMWDGGERTVESGSHYEYTDWTGDTLETPWVKIDERKVVDAESVPGYTEYYVIDTEPSRNQEDASWLVTAPESDEWVEFNTRSVGNGDATPSVVTYYAWSDKAKCSIGESIGPVINQSPPTTHVAKTLPNTGSGSTVVLGALGLALLVGGMVALRRRK